MQQHYLTAVRFCWEGGTYLMRGLNIIAAWVCGVGLRWSLLQHGDFCESASLCWAAFRPARIALLSTHSLPRHLRHLILFFKKGDLGTFAQSIFKPRCMFVIEYNVPNTAPFQYTFQHTWILALAVGPMLKVAVKQVWKGSERDEEGGKRGVAEKKKRQKCKFWRSLRCRHGRLFSCFAVRKLLHPHHWIQSWSVANVWGTIASQ